MGAQRSGSDPLRPISLLQESRGEPCLTSASDANGARAIVANGATAHRQALPSWSRERSKRQPCSTHMCRHDSQTRQGPALQPL